jgi:hypothetical protein
MKQPSPPTEPLPSRQTPVVSGSIDLETLAILEAWAREDATEDPATLRAARQELDEFKQAMNRNRAATGEPIVFP